MGARRTLSICAVVGALVASLVAVPPAAADFSSIDDLTAALDLDAPVVEDATFTGDQAGAEVLTASVAGFPTRGGSFLVLSTGRAGDITAPDEEGNRSTNLGGPPGAAGQDQVQLQLQLDPPDGVTCLTFDFRFFSEEYPEYVGSAFNDTFTAEIIDTDLQLSGGTIVTPYNFGYDSAGNAISVNTVLGMTDDEETTFDGTTPLLQAITPAETNDAGDVLVTLTVQDVGDSIYDSAVALDNFRWSSPTTCTAGATIVDADGDGLPDSWETDGLDVDDDGTVDVDLPAMGADPQRKDIFVEIDWMFDEPTCVWFICWGGDDFSPSPLAMQAVVAAFADAPVGNPDGSTGITLHLDAGPTSIMDAAGSLWGDLGAGNAVAHQDNLGGSTTIDGTFLDCAGNGQAFTGAYDWSAFDAVKTANFDPVRRDVFHYAIYADQYNNGTSSGISRGIPASDFIVSQGAFNGGTGFTLTQERGTLMHEFGHNLGLQHGGDDNCNLEPNYLSIMSYAFQFPGLRVAGIDGTLDYSRERLVDLDENALDETVGLEPDALVGDFGTRWRCGGAGRVVDDAAGAIDWNCNGNATQTGIGADINGDGTRLLVDGHDDWEGLRFDGGAVGALGDEELPTATPDEELTLELAEELGVLNGAHDALLDGPATVLLLSDTGERNITLDLHNVGAIDDTYSVAATTDLPNLAGPDAAAVAAGETHALTFTVDTADLAPGEYELAVKIGSVATAETVASHTVAVTIPDLTDPDIFADARDALTWLEDLQEGEGPPPAMRDELIDMLGEAVGGEPRPALQELRDDLAGQDGASYGRAVAALDRALADRRWVADDELATNGGAGVFAQLQQVVRELARPDGDPAVLAAASDTVVQAARDLLERKIELGAAAGVDPVVLDEAAEHLASGDDAAAGGNPRSAVMSYRDGWVVVNDAQA